MAILQVTLFSRSLMRTVPVTVILPVDKTLKVTDPMNEEQLYPTLYLLHGVLGSTLDWLSGTRIERWALERDLCVVMPSGDNAFYVDRPGSHNLYSQFIGEELVELTRRMFPLSRKREDTFIGGLSMGGYGAMRNGLKYHETFGAICALSGRLDISDFVGRTNGDEIFFRNRSYLEECFGDLEASQNDDRNPAWLVHKLALADFPAIYICCGESDFILPQNIAFHELLVAKGVEHTFETGPGAHEWDFWDRYILKVLDWLPLKKTDSGINSGNVGIK